MSFLMPRASFAPMRCGPAYQAAPFFSLIDETFNELQRASRQASRQFNPRFDVKETKESYSLEGELPGVEQKNISVEFTDEHTLTIKGRTESYTESGKRPEAIEVQSAPAIDNGTATPQSESSHHATVEDEEPANSTAAEENTEVAAPTTKEVVKAEEPKEQHWISERSVGEFSRSFSFPSRIDQEAVKASLKNGILSIVVPKAPARKSRRVNIE